MATDAIVYPRPFSFCIKEIIPKTITIIAVSKEINLKLLISIEKKENGTIASDNIKGIL